MERRLIEAAQTGDVHCLVSLVKDDPLLLRAVALAGKETPLHIACMAGHLSFVKEIIRLGKEFAGELNQEGFSPLHIASANGELEIVKELLKIDHCLCKVKGRERRIPLHYATIKGRVHITRELLLASVDSIEDVTARGENALHLAVKNNQFDAFQVLVEHLKQFNMEDVVNMKDFHGNTILHLAISQKQFEVVDLVMNEQVVAEGKLEVNSLNKKGLTPLDVLLMEGCDKEIEEILRLSGAKRAEDLQSSTQTTEAMDALDIRTESPKDERLGEILQRAGPFRSQAASSLPATTQHDSRTEQSGGNNPQSETPKDWFTYFRFHPERGSPGEARNALLVVAALIATVTFQAGVNPPSGILDVVTKSNSNNATNSSPTRTETSSGSTVLGFNAASALFLFPNTLGLTASVSIIHYLTSGFPFQRELLMAVYSMMFTYGVSIGALAENKVLMNLLLAIAFLLPFLTRFVPKCIRRAA